MGKNETSSDRGFQTFNLGGPCCVNRLSELGPLVIGVHDESVTFRLSHVQINLAWWRVGVVVHGIDNLLISQLSLHAQVCLNL